MRTTPARSSRAPPSSPASRRSIRSRPCSTHAHAAGMKVHAWVAVNLVSSSVTLPASRDHVIYRAPEWLMVPRELAAEMKKIDLRSPAYLGRLARWTRAHSSIVEGLYTSPLHPAAQDHTAAVIGEIAAKYAVDGVHLDYVRFPNEDFDYSPAAMEQFKAAILPDLTDREKREAAAREAARSDRLSESVSRALERLPPLAPDVAGHQDSHRGEDGAAGRGGQRRGGARRATGVRQPPAGLARLDRSVAARRDLPDGLHHRRRRRSRSRSPRRAPTPGRARSGPASARINCRRRKRWRTSPPPTSSASPASSCSRTSRSTAPPNGAGSVSELGRAAFGTQLQSKLSERVALRGRLSRHRRLPARHHGVRVVVRALPEDHPRLFPDRSQRAVVGDLLHDRRHRNQHADLHRHSRRRPTPGT